ASQAWFLGVDSNKRIAAINGLGIDRTYAHLILSEDPTQIERSNRYLQQKPFYLFTIAAQERSALLAQIQSLKQIIENCDDLAKAAARTYATFQEKERADRANYALAIVGSNKKELDREIQRALTGVERAFAQGGEWKTPLGSYFTAKPLGKRGGIAFVYSGGFTSYLGMASSLGHLFPKGFNDLASFPATKGRQRRIYTSSQAIYPRSLQKLSKRQVEALEAKLLDNSETMLASGSFIAQYYTKILRDYFQVQPQAAFGYSLGEVSMMVALDIWNDDDSMAEHIESSSLFKTRIDGPKNAVREYWGLPPIEETTSQDFWSSYVLLSGVNRVRDCLKNEDRVYITHINTPEEVAIAGDAKSCIRVIEKLGCSYFPAPFSVAIHCQPILSELGELTKLFTLPTQDGSQVKFYSSAECVPIAIDTQNVASQIARGICQQVNFPRLIDRVYDDGARIFIEVGAGNSCCRWVRETLKQKEQLVLSLNSRGVDDRTSMLRALAQLFSHGVSLDLSPLYCDLEVTSSKKKSLTTTINLGEEAIASKILTAENRQKFAPPVIPVVAESSLKASQSVAQQQKLKLTEARSAMLPDREKAIANASFNKESERASPPASPPTRGTNKELQPLAFNRAKLASSSSRELHHSTMNLSDRQVNTTKSSSLLPRSEISPPDRHLSLVLPRHKPAHVLFDEKELLEFAEGKIARVFGSEYAAIDSYPKRARLPLPPFLFVSRVTKLDASKGCFEPCSIETEYDIPEDAWYAFDGQVSIAIPLEASHSCIFLVSYLGIDFEAKGKRVFRNLGGSTTFFGDLPRIGDTLRCRTRINSFSRFGETFLLFFTYECFVGERMFLKMESGGGLFSQQELERGQGIITNDRERQKEQIQPQHFQPLLSCPKSVFEPEDFAYLGAGELAACFGSNYEQNGKNTSLCLPPLPIRMVDRVLSIDSQGGNWGLGSVIAEKTLDPQHWYFNCHFKDDYCLPGTLLTEGCTQLLAFYMLYCGLQTQTNDARFQPVKNSPQIGRYRGQIQPIKAKLTYHLEVTQIGLTPQPFAMANATIEFEGKTITMLKNIGICLSEKNR
ncbi:MAG: PfaB family protein, partial [Xenococcaceae cyanobacterium]